MKKHIILLLKTFINNNACVEAARTREKKYNIISPIFAFFALFFSALPVCVKGFMVKGEDAVKTTYGADDGLFRFSEDNKTDNNFKLTVEVNPTNNKKHILKSSKAWTEKPGAINECYDEFGEKKTKLENLYRYTYTGTFKGNKVNYLEVYYTEATGNDFITYYKNVASNKNPMKPDQAMKVERKDEKEKEKITATLSRSTSFIVFGKEQFFMAIYSQASTSPVSSLIGDYDHTAVGTDFIRSYAGTSGITTLAKWKPFFNEAYINVRWSGTWTQTGINLGINAGVLIVMGFVVWVTTRGKNNPFRIYTYWDSQKITFYACLTPGLIGLFGFFSTQLATMLFAMACGVRVLWLSMRTLKYTAPAK